MLYKVAKYQVQAIFDEYRLPAGKKQALFVVVIDGFKQRDSDLFQSVFGVDFRAVKFTDVKHVDRLVEVGVDLCEMQNDFKVR